VRKIGAKLTLAPIIVLPTADIIPCHTVFPQPILLVCLEHEQVLEYAANLGAIYVMIAEATGIPWVVYPLVSGLTEFRPCILAGKQPKATAQVAISGV
jgi:hypothetical protein